MYLKYIFARNARLAQIVTGIRMIKNGEGLL